MKGAQGHIPFLADAGAVRRVSVRLSAAQPVVYMKGMHAAAALDEEVQEADGVSTSAES